MKFDKFDGGNHFTIGAELEIRILDKFDLTPQNEFDYITENVNQKYKNNLAREFLGSMIEINTPIFHYEEDLLNYLKEIIEELKITASKKKLCLQTSGSYAQKNVNVKLNINERYEELYDEHKILLDNFTICGTHVHIGFEDSNKALKAYNYSLYYLPLFVALTASSVFYDNKNTGIHSYRTKIFDRLPKASTPEYFDSFEQMQDLYKFLNKSKVIQSTKDIWWDVRIQPHFKTLEFRVCDAVNDFDRLETIISLIKAMCQLSQIDDVLKMPMQVLKQNMWSATRYSMNAKMISQSGNLIPVSEMIENLAKKAYDNSFLTKQSLEKIIKIANKKSISQEMLEVYNRTKNIKDVERLGVFE